MKKKTLAAASLLLALLMPLGATPLAVYAEGEDTTSWYVSCSKTAAPLDDSNTSQVTLSLPSAEEALASDVVFVIDKSECGGESTVAAQALVSQLLAQNKLEKAKLNVGVVAFSGTAKVTRELSNITTAAELDAAFSAEAAAGLHGTNIQSGLIEADRMLSADTDVSDSRKYVVLVSDGRTYQFSKEKEYSEYVDGDAKFNALTTYGIYNEGDMYAYAYGITYTIHNMHDQYYIDDYNKEDGSYKGAWGGDIT